MEAVTIDLLRTPELQRLKRIRQLGLADQVFPAGEHSRFAHCLGAAYLAIRFGRQLQKLSARLFSPVVGVDETVVRDLAVAALCHDLGHGPMSHAWEREVIGADFDRKAWASSLGLDGSVLDIELKWHELVGQGLLGWSEGNLHRLLEEHERGSSLRIRELLRGRYYLAFLPRLLSSDVDVDRADFIRRDTHHTGVAYGRYDLDWLLSTVAIGTDKATGQWEIGFDSRKAVRVIEQFLIARRALYDTVYHHKTVRCAEGMMALFLRRLREVVRRGVKFEGRPEAVLVTQLIEGKALEPIDLLRLDDDLIFGIVEAATSMADIDYTLGDLARRIRERDYFKLVPVNGEKLSEFLSLPEAHQRISATVKPFCAGIPDFYYHVDFSHFRMLSDIRGQAVFLVDSSNSAMPAYEHEALQMYKSSEVKNHRIFAIREARDALTRMITAI